MTAEDPLTQLRAAATRAAETLTEAEVALWGMPRKGLRGVSTWATAWPLTGNGLTGLAVTPQGELVRLVRAAGVVEWPGSVMKWVVDNGYGGILQGLGPIERRDIAPHGAQPGDALFRVDGTGRLRVSATAMALDDALAECVAQLVRGESG
ncbi:MAG: hypothetical protein V9G19_14950 [Tetrasphaera sp.]